MTSADPRARGHVGRVVCCTAIVATLAAVVAACGDDASTAMSGSTVADPRMNANAVVVPTQGGASTAAKPSDHASGAPVPHAKRSHQMPGGVARGPAQTTPNGTVIVPPAAPTSAAASPSDRCVREVLPDVRGGTTAVTLPPPPGLRAHVVGGVVRVTIDTGPLPAACRPRFARILIDDSDYAYPPFGTIVRLDGLGEQTIEITPSSLPSAPTIVQASLGLRPELRGSEARIAIKP